MTEVPSLLEPIPVPQAMLAAKVDAEVAPGARLAARPGRNGRPVCSAASTAAAIEPDVATSSSTPGRTTS